MLNPVIEAPRWEATVGIKKSGNEIPVVYRLYQNYPNPFNPTTIINFDIVNSGVVKIVLYDILGKEVQTLVNDKFEPGKYNFTFNAGNLASGVYFYRISTDKFTDVKKLLLIK